MNMKTKTKRWVLALTAALAVTAGLHSAAAGPATGPGRTVAIAAAAMDTGWG
ncbi:hypothetical protein ACGFW5_03440 [Streptomyces sp. NPDC048416]|uniref:hypothetical protein n=1 Tax=Streptomyces sp. NPDC048416 TaxID=3365546 RepID=UPI003721C448